jgi:hypothetical protein
MGWVTRDVRLLSELPILLKRLYSGEGSKILNSLRASDLAWLPPTVHSNCSERLWLRARTFLVAIGNRLGWLGESHRSNSELAWRTLPRHTLPLSLFYLYLRQNANTTLSLQLPMKFGNIVRVETSRYLTKITTLRRPIAKVLAAKHTASLQLLCTVGGNQARSDAHSEFKILEPSPKGGVEAGRAHHCRSLNVN